MSMTSREKAISVRLIMTERIVPLEVGGTVTIGGLQLPGSITVNTVGTHTGSVVGDLTGNVTGDVVGDVVGDVTGDVVGDVTGDVVGNTAGTHTGAVVGNVTGDVIGDVTGDLTGGVNGTLTADLAAAGFSVTGLRAPVLSGDAATKSYADALASGLIYKDPCYAASTTNYIFSAYSGTPNFTLTNTGPNVVFSIDGVNPPLSSRVLIKDQATQTHNGIYEITTVGDGATPWVLTRTTDYDSSGEIAPGDAVFVSGGATNANTTFSMNNAAFTTLDTDNITWATVSRIVSPLTTLGDVYVRDGVSDTRLPVGADGEILVANSGAGAGLAWTAPSAATVLTTKGDLMTHTGAAAVRRAVGANLRVLTADSTQADGVAWSLPDHGNLAGLAGDDHTQYALLAGRFGDGLKINSIGPESGTTVALNSVNVTVPTAATFALARVGTPATSLTVSGTSTVNQALVTTASPTFVGTYMQTSGGVPKLLNHYEWFTDTVSMSGPWASPRSVTLKIQRIGQGVTFTLGGTAHIADASAGARITTAPIVSRLRPYATIYMPIVIINNSNEGIGFITIAGSTGDLTIGPVPSGTNFAKNQTAGFYGLTLSWTVA